jgi:protein-L-isoaspartate O-methyltransferase
MNLIRLPNTAYTHRDDPGEPGYPGRPARISVTVEDATMLKALVAGLDVLEIGAGLGISTAAMAETARCVYTCDIDPWVSSAVLPGLIVNYGNVIVVGRDGAPEVRVDAVFIDGLHTEAAVFDDIGLAQMVLRKPGLIIFHDTRLAAVQKAIRMAGLTVAEIETEYGLGVTRL